MQIAISKNDYLTIKALFAATSQCKDRPSLSHVYYDKDLNLLVACDGYILRVETPETVFQDYYFFSKSEFLKTEKLLKPFEFVAAKSEQDGMQYPRYDRAVPNIANVADLKPLQAVGLDLKLMDRVLKTFPKSTTWRVNLGFSSQLGAILMYSASDNKKNYQNHFGKFLGVIMACKLGQKSEYSVHPLPTLQNIVMQDEIANDEN